MSTGPPLSSPWPLQVDVHPPQVSSPSAEAGGGQWRILNYLKGVWQAVLTHYLFMVISSLDQAPPPAPQHCSTCSFFHEQGNFSSVFALAAAAGGRAGAESRGCSGTSATWSTAALRVLGAAAGALSTNIVMYYENFNIGCRSIDENESPVLFDAITVC